MKTKVGDKAPKAVLGTVAALIVGSVKKSELTAAPSTTNRGRTSGKKLGALIATNESGTPSLHVALGSNAVDKWVTQGTGAEITPTGTIAKQGLLGDRKPKASGLPVAALDMPVVLQSDLGVGDNPINSSYHSGKQLGATVIAETGIIYVAEGSGPEDKWTPQTDKGTQITPSKPTKVVDTTKMDKQRKAINSIACSVHIPVVSVADLTKSGSLLNDTSVSGKTFGATVAATTNGVTSIYMANGKEPADGWVNIKGAVTTVPTA